MKKFNLLFVLLMICGFGLYAQTAFNPFTQNIHFVPEPTAFGFECGSTPFVEFTQGLTTAADATQWQTDPLTVTICLTGFTFNGPASSVVTGTYANNFNWAYVIGSPNCIIGTQNQTLPGTGSNPIFPNPNATGNIKLALKVPDLSPVGTVLGVNVTLQVPSYMSFFNSIPDDNESTQTQTFCGCYPLTDAGTIGADQSFCASGNPALFNFLTPASGGSGGVILYQWQQLIAGNWTDISGATNATYDASVLTTTTSFRRTAKRSLCGTWLNSNPVTVTINSLPIANAGGNKITSCTTPNAVLGVSAVSGYTYSWSPAAGLNVTTLAQPTANPLTTTTYTVTVTGSNGCTATSVATVTVDKAPPTANAGANTTLTCSTTSAVIGTSNTAGYTYSWSPSNGLSATNISNPTASPLATTTYTVTVTAANGCTATSSVIVTVNTVPPVANSGGTKTTSCSNPTATLGVTTVVGNSYTWSPTTGLNNPLIAQPIANPLVTTTYTVTVTGSNGCTATSIATVIVDKALPIANAGSTSTITCLTTSVSIGTTTTSGYTYLWSPAASLNVNNISNPIATPSSTTTYTVTVTGANGCTATSSVLVNVNNAPPVAISGGNKTITCTTPSTTLGAASVAGNSYSWSPSAGLNNANSAQPVATPLSTTTYTVTVTGANGCTATSVCIVTVNKNTPLANAGSNAVVNCSTTSASIGTTTTPGYSYDWSPALGLSSTTVSNPVASPSATTIYTVTVTASNGCTAISTVSVTVNTVPPIANAGGNFTTTCINPTATLGVPVVSGYTYNWNPATGLNASNVAQPIANPLNTTTYTLTVTGTNGCTSTSTSTVTVNKSLPIANAGSTATITCLTTSASIGTTTTAGYSYSWSPSAGLSSTTISNPIATPTSSTIYTVTVTGANGCTATSTVMVNVNTTPPTANSGGNKTITCLVPTAILGAATVSGYTYTWTPSAGLSATNIAQPIANPLATTTYTVSVTGANGCTATSVATVTVDKDAPIANAGTSGTITCTTTSLTLGTSATPGYTYAWSPSTALSSTTSPNPIANPIAAITYTVTVTGANGCTATSTVNVNVNTVPPIANAGGNKTINCTVPSAIIGSPNVAGNIYSWAPSSGLSAANIAQPSASPLATTTYTLTVTGANGCTATSTSTITVDKVAPIANAGSNATLTCLTISASIGTTTTAGYSYFWLPSAGLSSTTISNPMANPTANTIYTVTVTGANGCTATSTVTINVNTTPPVANAGNDKDVCSLTSVQIGTPSIAGNSYLWTPSTGLNSNNIAQPTANPLSTTSYTVVVTGANGCTSTDVVVVNFREGSIGNYVWSDLNADGLNNEPSSAGINGVTVQLWTVGVDNIQGTSDDQLQGTTVTTNNSVSNPGFYNFIICQDGTYYVKFPLTTNGTDTLTSQTTLAATDNNSDADVVTGMSPVFTILTNGSGVAKNNNTIDAGYLTTLSLGNLVWEDANRDGLKGVAELGINGATVNLYVDANNDGTPDGAAIATTTTNANGLYVFNELFPGNYILGVIAPVVGSGNPYVSSVIDEVNPNSNMDNNDNGISTISNETFSGTVTLLGGTEPLGESPNNGTSPDGSSNLTVDFGFYQPVNISGNVYVDNNGATNVDGIGTGSASGNQLFATLINSSGIVVAVVPVNPNGSYTFSDIMPNTTYSVLVGTTLGTIGSPAPLPTLPTGWSNVSEDCCDNTGNDGTTNGITTVVVGNNDVSNVNFGITQPLSLGNAVWNDINRNGILDGAESGISGASVSLYLDANSDGFPDGPAVQNTTTNSNGLYVFNGLTPGNYIVGVTPPSISGGSYSSSPINEANPNLNVDNNDNGIITNGAETLSGTIDLAAGTEPTGELPNNATAPDANANLTVDFGFFLCPSGFTFTPVYVCPGTTVNLTSLEPVGYTGGVWTTSTGAVVTNPNVSAVGTYTYTYENGTCVATGTINLIVNVPDYTPTITIAPSAITGISNVRVIINIAELLNRTPCGDIYVLVPRLEPRFTFNYQPTATNIGGVAVSNGDWQYFTSNPSFYVWKYVGSSAFPGGGSSKFGYIGSYDPNETDGETTFSVQIFQGSGGETILTNNTDSESLIYFR